MKFDSKLLEGKTIAVTGAGKGLGRRCAELLASCGARVIAVARTGADLESLSAAYPGLIEAWVEDVCADSLMDRFAELDTLDGLLNNAGTNRVGPMAERSDEDLDAVLDLNVRSLYRVSRAALPALKRSGDAAVVNMSSQMGHVGSPNRTLYCMSKHAVEGLTKAMAVELAGEGVRVNSVAPTFVLTPMTEPMFEDPAFKAFVMGMIPMQELAKPDDIANACVFLLSDLSRMITGTSLKVDGGWTAR